MKVLQDIWIIENSGILLFKRIFDENIDENFDDQLLSGILTAINKFATTLTEGGLTKFGLSNKNYFLKNKNNFLFIITATKRTHEKQIIEQLELLSEKFFESYPLDWLKNEWDRDISCFSNFREFIEDLLEDSVESFWDGII